MIWPITSLSAGHLLIIGWVLAFYAAYTLPAKYRDELGDLKDNQSFVDAINREDFFKAVVFPIIILIVIFVYMLIKMFTCSCACNNCP